MRTPIIVGAAQVTERWREDSPRLDPLSLMVRASDEAFADTRAPQMAMTVDAAWVVNTITWSYADAPGMLAERLGLPPGERFYSAVGGNTPQNLVHGACRALANGRLRAVLLTGAEAGYSVRRATREGIDLGWPTYSAPTRIDGVEPPGTSALEMAYELVLPSLMYAVIETAIRAGSGRSPAAHARVLGEICARLSSVAAKHPYAWFRTPRMAEEIATPTAENRYVGYPYTKWMNATMSVDQGAALVLTTTDEARRLGIPQEQWVYPMGAADLCDVWHVSRRRALDRSPAIRIAARAALEQAGVTIDEVDLLDLYSCFPSAIEIACDALEIGLEDNRGLTVTGGLPYFGGPGNNYSMHAIATVVDAIRAGRSRAALVGALGWYVTKHSFGVYGTRPAKRPWGAADLQDEQRKIDASALPEPETVYDGTARAEAFVIRHRRDGTAKAGVLFLRADDGRRILAQMDLPQRELEELENEEVVGSSWRCRHDTASGKNLAKPL